MEQRAEVKIEASHLAGFLAGAMKLNGEADTYRRLLRLAQEFGPMILVGEFSRPPGEVVEFEAEDGALAALGFKHPLRGGAIAAVKEPDGSWEPPCMRHWS